VLRAPSNLGVAGGYALGLDYFVVRAFDYAWAMDDDVYPRPDCLTELLAEMQRREGRAIVVPRFFDRITGERDDRDRWGWVGVLIPRSAVAEAGVPDVRLFWGFEEQEYFRDRLPLAGYTPVVCEASQAELILRPETAHRPAWKYYYSARNRVYRALYDRPHLPWRLRLLPLVHALLDDFRRVLTQEDRRVEKFVALVHGCADGVLKRLGKRVEPTTADRPWDAA
jgi:rhamnopyranosyl-N-acetylglucosaminyl-diphospho-decaprenol beta-1,3/1,4-galactofuranosyltransferase